jgi:hypothetical protein
VLHYRDVPKVVFHNIYKLATQSEFGILVKTTRATTTLKIIKPGKLLMLLKIAREDLRREELLQKIQKNGCKGEVIVNSQKPFLVKYNVNHQRLTINFKYGFWNQHGVPQHH